MQIRIKKIHIQGFRGIPDLELELGGKSFLLRGENGTGKSSIVDAIEFFFTGGISHLEKVQGLSLQRHAPHVRFTLNDVKVEMTFNPGNISLCRTFTSNPIPSNTFEDYFQVTHTGNFIFRRSQILEFIVCKPADRYKTIGNIIGVKSLDDIEVNMKNIRDDLKKKLESEKTQIRQLYQDLSSHLEEEVTEFHEIHPTLNKKLGELGLPPIGSLAEDYEYVEGVYIEAKRKDDGSNKINILGEINDEVKTLFFQESVLKEVEKLNRIIEHRLQDEKRERVDLSLLNVLQTGRRLIEEKEMDICPLCSQKIAREEVILEVEQRLKMLHALSKGSSEIQSISFQLVIELEGLLEKLNLIKSKMMSLSEFSGEQTKLKDIISFMEDLAHRLDHPGQQIPTSEIVHKKCEMEQLKMVISERCAQLIESVGLTKEERAVLGAVRLIEQVKSKTREIPRIESEIKIDKEYYDVAEKMYSIFSETKKTRIQDVYNIIQEDVKRFYFELHPGEPHGNIELMIDPKRRASTKLKMDLLGQEGEDPRAYASEGHLDSLGLCIFLAFIRKFNENCSLIVLDDVVTTIDAQHRENICKLLLKEFEDKQIFLTTHDGVWYEQICASQRAYGKTGNFKNMIILGWDEDAGPRIKPYKARWERIQEKLAAGDKNGAGNDGRGYLEWVLEEICEITQAPVPFKSSGRYEVRDLFGPVEKRLEDLIRDDQFCNDVTKALTELERTMIMGNLLSHNNADVERVSIEEVKSFCDAIDGLHKTFLCSACGCFLGYYRELKIMRCSNPSCSHPAEVKTK